MGQGESSFYHVHGHNVYLRDNGTSVERATDSRTHTIAFTKKSLELNGLFQIKVLVKREDKKLKKVTSQVVIGITTQNPSIIKNLSNCSSLYELQNSSNGKDNEYWCVEFITNTITSKSSTNHRLIKVELAENDIVGLMLTKSGYVHLLINGIDQEVLWNNLPTDSLPLWGVLELNGTVTCIKAEYKNITTFSTQQQKVNGNDRPLPPLPNDIPVTKSLNLKPHPSLTPPLRQNPKSFRRPLPATLPPSSSLVTPSPPHSPVPPSHSPVPPPRSPVPPPRSLASLRARRHVSVDNTPSLTNTPTSSLPTATTGQYHDLQRILREQSLQISELEKERNEIRETKNDLRQQVEILRMQLVQRQKSPPLPPSSIVPEPQLTPPTTTTPIELDISFWEINSSELEISDEIIGRGGWGEVRKGNLRGTKVAVKKLYSEILSPYYVSLVKREISMMAKIRHPNLVLFIGASLDDTSESPMIILELLGDSLRHAYQNGKLDSLSIKLVILRDVACALNYLHCHSQEIIHRDVSSANVLLEPLAGGVFKGKLSDFGSANLARLAVTAAPGAEVYTAPEVPRNSISDSLTVSSLPNPQTTKIDVYSFGVLLCEVIAGTFPIRQVFEEMLQNVRGQSVTIKQLIDVCIEVEPTNRPTMSNVLVQLNDILLQI